MTQRDKWSHRPIIDRYWAFKDQLVLLAKQQNFILGDRYGVTFFIPMPDSWSKKKKEDMIGKPHQNKPDLDNICKACQDCLKTNDATVYEIEASKLWWDEGKIIFYELRKI